MLPHHPNKAIEVPCPVINHNVRCYIEHYKVLNWPYLVYYDKNIPVASLFQAMGEIAISVDPEYRNLGIGTLLFEIFLEWKKESSFDFLHRLIINP